MSTNKGFLGWGPTHTPECSQWLKGKVSEDDLKVGILGRCQCPGGAPKPGDEKLLKYLYDHKHMTPFEMAGLVIEVQAPIFVFREWHRHRTQSYNELSARYTPLPDVNYVPTLERILMRGGANKQAQGSRDIDEEGARLFLKMLDTSYQTSQLQYAAGLELGVPKELARLVIPVGRYSRMRASANLRNWLAFLTLRMDPAAQWEIRQYANAVGEIIAKTFPRTWDLFSKN